jgi:hypothetical protein
MDKTESGSCTMKGVRRVSHYNCTSYETKRQVCTERNSDKYQQETPRRYPYFGVVAGLVWSNDPENYAGSSVCYW